MLNELQLLRDEQGLLRFEIKISAQEAEVFARFLWSVDWKLIKALSTSDGDKDIILLSFERLKQALAAQGFAAE